MCGGHWANAHVLGVYAGMCIGYQAGQWLDTARFGSACFHQHHSGGGIVDA